MCYTTSVNLIEFRIESSVYDQVLVTIDIKDENLSSLKYQNLVKFYI